MTVDDVGEDYLNGNEIFENKEENNVKDFKKPNSVEEIDLSVKFFDDHTFYKEC